MRSDALDVGIHRRRRVKGPPSNPSEGGGVLIGLSGRWTHLVSLAAMVYPAVAGTNVSSRLGTPLLPTFGTRM